MINIVLVHPEIPPNTGNIIRQCAVTGAQLHLVEPLGFDMDHKQLVRAGLDYFEYAPVKTYPDLDALMGLPEFDAQRCFAFTSNTTRGYHTVSYRDGDWLMFGCESQGLAAETLARVDASQRVRIPMVPDRRSLNLSNAVCIALYEAMRQLDFPGTV